MPEHTEILILGGGPAGSAVAISSAPERRVLVVDAGTPKLCGGLLNAESQEAFQALIGRDPHLALVDTDVLVHPLKPPLRFVDDDTSVSFRFSPNYLNMDRLAFDRWLLCEAENRGAIIRRKTMAKSLERIEKGWRVRVGGEKGEQVIEADCLVLATGFHGLARLIPGFKGAGRHEYLALQKSVECAGFDEMIALLDNKHVDYFGWIIPKGDTAHVGVAVPPTQRAAGEAMIRDLTTRFLGLVGDAEGKLRGCPIGVPLSERAFKLDVLPGAFAVGEAAGLISPSSGDGISYALHSGRIVGEWLAQHPAPQTHDDFEQAIRELAKTMGFLTRKIDRAIFKANLMRSPRIRRIGAPLLKTGIGKRFAKHFGVALD